MQYQVSIWYWQFGSLKITNDLQNMGTGCVVEATPEVYDWDAIGALKSTLMQYQN